MIRSSLTTIFIFALMAIIVVVSGCSHPPQPTVIVAVDMSGSARKDKTDYADTYKQLCTLDNGDSKFTLYTFAQKPHYVTEGESSNLLEAYQLSEFKIAKADTSQQKGTFFAPVMEVFQTDAANHPNIPYIGILLTDGQIDDKDQGRLNSAIKALADQPNFRGLLVGPATAEVITLRKEFKPLLDSHKLVLAGTEPADMSRGIEEILAKKNEVK